MSKFVNFDNYNDEEFETLQAVQSKQSNKSETKGYTRNGKPVIFDDSTMLYYKTLRERRMDPVLLTTVNENLAFKFEDQWNPYTGERLGPDPYGPIYFHPDTIIHYLYVNRLNDLWKNEASNNGEYYEGYYDDAVGAGEDIYIESRGSHPERYLFRLPIIDCYILPSTNKNSIASAIITMGPKLTECEIKKIDELGKKCGSSYKETYGKDRPSLTQIKKYYDIAICPTPQINESVLMTQAERAEAYAKTNRYAVDILRAMKG